MNPWLLLTQVIATVVLMVVVWEYRGHIDSIAQDDAIKTIQQEAQTKHDQDVEKERNKTQQAAEQEKQNEYAYQHDKDQLQRSLADANDTAGRLRDAIKVYAAGYVEPVGKSATASIPVSAANERIGRLADLAGVLESDGRKAAGDAVSCAVKLTACEKWADGVETEFGVKH